MNYEVAPFPLNNPLSALQLRDEVEVKPYDVRGGMRKRFAPHAFYHHASVRQILKINERAYHASKFSKLLR